MAEINGYLLTDEEEQACEELIKKMRKKRLFSVDFTGSIRIRAKSQDEATEIFWNWVGDIQDRTLGDWSRLIILSPDFDYNVIEEE